VSGGIGAGGLVTLGEVLGTASATAPGPLEVGASLRLSFAGAEATVAIAAARLGVPAAFIGRVGDDPIGRLIRHRLAAEGVDVAGLRIEPGGQTGVLLKHPRTAGRVEVSYARRGSAGSRLAPADLDPAVVRAAGILHVTGITPALGEGSAAAVAHAVDLARDAGVPVSLDLNHRARLWSRADAAAVLAPLARRAEIVMASAGELALVAADPAELLAAGVREVVVTDGARGARVVTPEGEHELPALPATVVDPVGAGDAFAGGYLAARLRGADPAAGLAQAVRVAAFAVATIGDWEGLPRTDELGRLDGAEEVSR
jgi:2-dehydro-3-deoxygluconokinase